MAYAPRLVAALCAATALCVAGTSLSFEELARRAEEATGKNPSEAATLYRQALELRPGWAEGWLYLGASLMETGSFADARNALRKGAELEPGRGTAWAYLGLAEYELGEYDTALAHIAKGEAAGLADRPDFVAAVRYHAALIDLRNGAHAAALEQLRPLARDPSPAPAVLQVLGISALFLDKLPEQLSPAERIEAELAGRATAAFFGERPQDVAAASADLIHRFGSLPGVRYMCAVFLIDSDPDAAAAQLREELRNSPDHFLARAQLSLIRMRQGAFDEAETLARQASQLRPQDPLGQVTLGRVFLASGQTNLAIAALETGEKLAPEAAQTHFYLQQAYTRGGRAADAQREKDAFNRLRDKQEPVTITPPAR